MIVKMLRALGLMKPKKVDAWPVIPPFQGQFAAELATLREAERRAYERNRPQRERFDEETRQMYERNRRLVEAEEKAREDLHRRRRADPSWNDTPLFAGGLAAQADHASRADYNDTAIQSSDTSASSGGGSCGD